MVRTNKAREAVSEAASEAANGEIGVYADGDSGDNVRTICQHDKVNVGILSNGAIRYQNRSTCERGSNRASSSSILSEAKTALSLIYEAKSSENLIDVKHTSDKAYTKGKRACIFELLLILYFMVRHLTGYFSSSSYYSDHSFISAQTQGLFAQENLRFFVSTTEQPNMLPQSKLRPHRLVQLDYFEPSYTSFTQLHTSIKDYLHKRADKSSKQNYGMADLHMRADKSSKQNYGMARGTKHLVKLLWARSNS